MKSKLRDLRQQHNWSQAEMAADPGQKFAYSELAVVLWIGGTQWSANTGGGVALYGAEDHADTMLTLNPGESVGIIGKGICSPD